MLAAWYERQGAAHEVLQIGAQSNRLRYGGGADRGAGAASD